MNSINWPVSSVWVFIAQLGEHCSANAEATGSNPVEAPKKFFHFFGLFRNCLNCDLLRWSHIHFICIPAVHIISSCIRIVPFFRTGAGRFAFPYIKVTLRDLHIGRDVDEFYARTSCHSALATTQNRNQITRIDSFHILKIELGLACNRGSCGEYH